MKLALISSLDYHHECYIFFIAYCLHYNYTLDLYIPSGECQGWPAWCDLVTSHDSRQGNYTWRSIYDLSPLNIVQYDKIIVNTSTDDAIVLKLDVNLQRTIIMEHRAGPTRPPLKPNVFYTRRSPYIPDDHAIFPVHYTCISPDSKERLVKQQTRLNILIISLVGKNLNVLERILKGTDNICVNYVGRKSAKDHTSLLKMCERYNVPCNTYNDAPAKTLYDLALSASYILCNQETTNLYKHLVMSGAYPIALASLAPIILPVEFLEYMDFTSAIGYTDNDDPIRIPSLSRAHINIALTDQLRFTQRSFNLLNQLMTRCPTLPLDRRALTVNDAIPHNFHFMWTDQSVAMQSIPVKYKPNVNGWRAHHAQWEVYVWTTSSISNVMKQNNPELHEWYLSIDQAYTYDIARLYVVYVYGGVYVDLDFVCVRSLDDLVKNRKTLVIPELTEHIRAASNKLKHDQITNGFFGFTARHPFLWFLLRTIRSKFELYEKQQKQKSRAFYFTGPQTWTKALVVYNKQVETTSKYNNVGLNIDDTVPLDIGIESLITPFTSTGKLSMDYTGQFPIFCYTVWFNGSRPKELHIVKKEKMRMLIDSHFKQRSSYLQTPLNSPEGRNDVIVIGNICLLCFLVLLIVICIVVYFTKVRPKAHTATTVATTL